MNWRVYGEEALARRGVALWLGGGTPSVEYGGETLSRYEAAYRPRSPELFETAYRRKRSSAKMGG